MNTFVRLIVMGAVVAGTVLGGTGQATETAGSIPSGGFANCTQAYAAGYSNIPRTSPAYAPRLDRDGDGVACER